MLEHYSISLQACKIYLIEILKHLLIPISAQIYEKHRKSVILKKIKNHDFTFSSNVFNIRNLYASLH